MPQEKPFHTPIEIVLLMKAERKAFAVERGIRKAAVLLDRSKETVFMQLNSHCYLGDKQNL